MFREGEKKKKTTQNSLKMLSYLGVSCLSWLGSWESFWGGVIRKVLKLEGLRLGLVELEDEQEIPSWLLRGKGRGKIHAQNETGSGNSSLANPWGEEASTEGRADGGCVCVCLCVPVADLPCLCVPTVASQAPGMHNPRAGCWLCCVSCAGNSVWAAPPWELSG